MRRSTCAVLCSIDMFGALLKERGVVNGDYLAGQVTNNRLRLHLACR
jgi:hypothetical protein